MLRIYAKWLVGKDERAKRQIDENLREAPRCSVLILIEVVDNRRNDHY